MAIRNLERQGFETFEPKINITIKKINLSIRMYQYFLDICLLVLIHKTNWTKINSTYGVAKVLTFNNKVSIISYDLISALKNRYEENFDQTIDESLEKGDVIKFKWTICRSNCKIEAVDDKNRIWLILEGMGGDQKLKLHQNERLKYIKRFNQYSLFINNFHSNKLYIYECLIYNIQCETVQKTGKSGVKILIICLSTFRYFLKDKALLDLTITIFSSLVFKS